MATKDWRQVEKHVEYKNDKKKLTLFINNIYGKTVINVYSSKKNNTVHQRIFINRINALKYAKNYMMKN